MKSVHTLLAEAHDALRKDPAKMKQYRELVPITVGTPIEVLLNCANAILAGKITEARQNIVMHNGAAHNGHAQELRESAEPLTEAISPGRTSLQAHLVAKGILSESEASSLTRLRKGVDGLGKPCTYLDPAIPAGLSESERTEFKFARAIGFNEAQALVFIKTKTKPAKPGRF